MHLHGLSAVFDRTPDLQLIFRIQQYWE